MLSSLSLVLEFLKFPKSVDMSYGVFEKNDDGDVEGDDDDDDEDYDDNSLPAAVLFGSPWS